MTSSISPLDADALLKALNDHDVEYIVIGGFAMMAHDATRATKNVDVVPDPDPRNLDRLWSALQSLEASPLPVVDFGPEEMPLEWTRDRLDYGGNWILATRAGRLDVLKYVAGVDGYDQLRSNAVHVVTEVAGRIWFCGKDDLIAMKRVAGRPQDLLDIERIERDGEDPITGF